MWKELDQPLAFQVQCPGCKTASRLSPDYLGRKLHCKRCNQSFVADWGEFAERIGMPVLVQKFQSSVDAHFAPKQAERIKALFAKGAQLDALPVNELMAALVTNGPGA